MNLVCRKFALDILLSRQTLRACIMAYCVPPVIGARVRAALGLCGQLDPIIRGRFLEAY